jgi:D-3-phosphoglycerate dehydrogenase
VALEGLLSPLLENVNSVNAPVVAKERNIEVTTVERERAEGYETLMRVTVKTEKGDRTIAGTLFQGGSPRIVEIEGIPLEARVAPRMLYTRNTDKPGYIGALGSALGDNGINIASFHLGRNQTGDASDRPDRRGPGSAQVGHGEDPLSPSRDPGEIAALLRGLWAAGVVPDFY